MAVQATWAGLVGLAMWAGLVDLVGLATLAGWVVQARRALRTAAGCPGQAKGHLVHLIAFGDSKAESNTEDVNTKVVRESHGK